jgi:hypothetical protein
MRGFWAVMRREVVQRRMVFAGAAFAAALSLIAPLAVRGYDAGEVRSAMASVLAGLTTTGIAVVFGATMFGPDPSRGALRFLFSRPIGGGAVWAGKGAAALVLLLGAFGIALLPVLVGDPASLTRADYFPFGDSPQLPALSEHLPGAVALLSLLLAPMVFFFAHVVAVILRARAWWIALHALLALAFAAAVAWSFQRIDLGPWSPGPYREFLLRALSGVLVVALATASLLAVRIGRADPQRAHRALAWTLWPVLGLAGVSTVAGTARVMAPRPNDLVGVMGVAAPSRGSWVLVDGMTRWARAQFLLNGETGHWQRLASLAEKAVLSPDGSRAIWMAPDEPHFLTSWTLMTSNLRAPEPESEPSTISTWWPSMTALSPTGRRAAVLTSERNGWIVSVFDVPSSKQLCATKLTSGLPPRWLGFATEEIVRVLLDGDAGGIVEDLGIHGERLSERTTPGRIFVVAAADDEGARFVVRVVGGVALLDADRGDLVPLLSWPGSFHYGVDAVFLADGTIAINYPAGHVTLFEPDGRLRREVAIPGSQRRVRLGGEPTRGTLLVAASRSEASRWNLVEINSTSGVSVTKDRDLVPAVAGSRVGSIGNELFRDASSGYSLIRRDPNTGRRETLVRTAIPERLSWLVVPEY